MVDFAALEGRRVGVTGAGFIGDVLARRLRTEGATVALLDIAPAAAATAAEAGAEFRLCDTTDAGAVANALADCDLVVHTAAYVTDWGRMREFVRVNVGGTRNVLDAARGRHVVHLSSVAAFGYEARHEVAEDAWPRRVGGPYFDTKAASDELARRRGAAIVRPGDVYGPASKQWVIRPFDAIVAGRMALAGRGEGLITPVYVDDLVDCVVRALVVEESAGQAFHAWDGVPVPAIDYFGHLARMAGKDRVQTLPRPLMTVVATAMEVVGRVRGTQPDVTREALRYLDRTATYSTARAREVLGWRPQVDLEEGMRRVEAWLIESGRL